MSVDRNMRQYIGRQLIKERRHSQREQQFRHERQHFEDWATFRNWQRLEIESSRSSTLSSRPGDKTEER